MARRLKYFSPETDYAQLERELKGGSAGSPYADDSEEIESEEYDEYDIPPASDEDDWPVVGR